MTRLIAGLLAATVLVALVAAPARRAETAAPFKRAMGTRTWRFPRDHGRHDAYRIEWWYYTGIVRTTAGRAFGYQVTFFRQGLRQSAGRTSAWAADSLYLGHVALSDIDGKRYLRASQAARGSLGIAGAAEQRQQVWLRRWRADPLPDDPNGVRLRVETDDFALELTLRATKGPVLHGQDGLDRKGPRPGQASWYYSMPRLRTAGTVALKGERLSVAGTTWMDHEFGTNQLADDQAGWDWFALRLDDGTDLMLYRLRRADGSAVPQSSGTFVDAAGRASPLALGPGPQGVYVEPLRHWRSEATGARYPVAWHIEVPSHGLRLEVRPYFDAQEQRPGPGTPFPYWEGAVRVSGTRDGAPIAGEGYVELTGYAGDLESAFR